MTFAGLPCAMAFSGTFPLTTEFGVMMAMGTTPRRLTKILLIESMSMTLIGIIAGIGIGIGITYYFQIYGIDFSGGSMKVSERSTAISEHQKVIFECLMVISE